MTNTSSEMSVTAHQPWYIHQASTQHCSFSFKTIPATTTMQPHDTNYPSFTIITLSTGLHVISSSTTSLLKLFFFTPTPFTLLGPKLACSWLFSETNCQFDHPSSSYLPNYLELLGSLKFAPRFHLSYTRRKTQAFKMSRSFQKRPGEVFKEHSPNPQGGEDLDSDSEIAPIPIEAFDDVHRQKSQSTSDHFNTSFDGNTDQRFSGSSSQEPFAPAFSHKRSRIESEYKDGSNTTRTKAYSGKGFERSFDSSPHRDTRDMPHPSGPARRFAPAFSRKKQNPEAKFEERVAVPYSCLSSQKFDVTAGPVGPWNRFGLDKDNTGSSPTISSHDSTGNRKVEDLFVPVRDIMNERNIPKSLFEARNASVLVASGSTIVNKIGDSTLEWENKSDDRFKHMDEDGNYVDGTDRGRPKKRKMEERQMRLQERRDQVEHATTVMEDWERLSQEEKDKRYAIAKENHAIMMKSLEMEVCDEIPEMYLQTGKQKDLSVFVEGPEHSSGDEPLFVYSDDESVDDLQVTTDASRDEQSLITQRTANAENVSLPYRSPPAGTESFLPVGHQTRRLPGTGNLPLGGPSTLRPVAPKEPRPAGMESRLVGAGSPSAVADSRPVGPETEGSYQSKYTGDSLRDGIYGRTRATAKLKTNPKKRSSAPGYIIKSTYGSDPRQQTPTSMHLAPPSTPTPCIPRHPPPPTEQPPTRPDLRDSTYFAVKSWSEPTPFEDIPNHPSLHQRLGENKEKYQKIIHFAETQGRLVAVSLAPGVLFSGEAIVARVFGGAVQEFQ